MPFSQLERSGADSLRPDRGNVEHLPQVQRTRVLGDRGKALRDLGVAQPAFDPQLTLHVVSDGLARAGKLTR